MVLQLQDHVTLVNPGVSQLRVRDDGRLLASAGWDHRVRLFGWKKLRPLAVLQYHTDMVLSVAFSDHQDPRQRLLAAGSKDQRISLWSVYNEGSNTGWISELREDLQTEIKASFSLFYSDSIWLLVLGGFHRSRPVSSDSFTKKNHNFAFLFERKSNNYSFHCKKNVTHG